MTTTTTGPPRAIVRPSGWGAHYRHLAALERASDRIPELHYDRYDPQRRRYVLSIAGWDHQLALTGSEVEVFLAAYELGATGALEDAAHRELAA